LHSSFSCYRANHPRITRSVRWERMERVKGIEPSSSAWKAVALPLSYTRERHHNLARESPPSLTELRRSGGSAGSSLPTGAPPARRLVGEVGLEPTKA